MLALLRRNLLMLVSLIVLATSGSLYLSHARTAGWEGEGPLIGHDFASFYAAARLAVAGEPAAAYDQARHRAMQKQVAETLTGRFDDSYFYFGYPPTFLLALAPLGLGGYLTAFALFIGVTLGLMLAVVRLITRSWRAPVLALAAPITLETVIFGQNGFATAGLAGLGLWLLPRAPFFGGMAIGLLTIKPQLGLAYPVLFLVCRLWRAIAGAAVSASALAAASWIGLGGESWRAFLSVSGRSRDILLEQSSVGFGRINSVFAALRLTGVDVTVAYAGHGLVAALVLAALIHVCRQRGVSHPTRAAMTIAAGLAFSPFTLIYDAMALVVAVAFLWARPAGPTRGLDVMTLGLAASTALGIIFSDVSGLLGLPLTFAVLALAWSAARADRAVAGQE